MTKKTKPKQTQETQAVAATPRKRAYSVKETAKELSVCVAQVYVMLGRCELRGKKAGKRIVILGEEIDRYLNSLPDAVINLPPSRRAAVEARAARSQ
jgi:Helix-turn-helix domain